MQRTFLINGLWVTAEFDDRTVNEILRPLLLCWQELQRKKGERLIILMAAPPGTGKSTLAAFLQELARDMGIEGFQAVGMDGFHYHQEYILSHTVCRGGEEIPMQRIKGAPESFDADKLKAALQRLRTENVCFPVYDRTRHDVLEEALPVTADIVLVEGNYLLLDRDVWRELPCDASVFIEAEEGRLRERLLARKRSGGATAQEAERHYENADGPNIRLTLQKRRRADLTLVMTGDGALALKEDITE